MKTYRVGTFYHPPTVSAYLRDFNPAWTGCMVFHVEAESGGEATKKAKALRKDYEATRARIGSQLSEGA